MNERFSTQEMAALLAHHTAPAVSIYLPTHRAITQITQDTLQLRNQLKEAESKLLAMGLRSPVARDLLAPAYALIEETPFWQNQSDGLALFLSENTFLRYRLPLTFTPTVIVAGDPGARFHIKPLLPLLTNDGTFYLLALSQNDVRLLRGTRRRIEAIAPAGIPTSLAEAMRYDDPERQLQYHTANAPGATGSRGGAIFHGHGGDATNAEKDHLLRFFQQIDRGLRDFLETQRAPLVLAGVEYLLPIYQQANSYPHLMDTGIPGSPDFLSDEELHTAAWTLVEPVFQAAQDAALADYQRLAGTGRTATDLAELVPAADHGRVAAALIAQEAAQWGDYDPHRGTVEFHDVDHTRLTDLTDLTDLFAVYTYLRGGDVFVLPAAAMPNAAPVAAIYRY